MLIINTIAAVFVFVLILGYFRLKKRHKISPNPEKHRVVFLAYLALPLSVFFCSFAIPNDNQLKPALYFFLLSGSALPLIMLLHHKPYKCPLLTNEDCFSAQTSKDQRMQLSALQLTNDYIMIVDANRTIEYVNPAFEKEILHNSSEVIGKKLPIMLSDMHDADFYKHIDEELESGNAWSGEIITRRKDNSLFTAELTITPIISNGIIEHYVSVGRNVSYRKDYEESLIHMAHQDSLTKLPNRFLFLDRLAHSLRKAKRNSSELAVLFVDLDRFKCINDTLGHNVGDSLLKETAWRLKTCLRECDTLARMGGDEFTVILEETKGHQEITAIATRVLKTMSEIFEVEGHQLVVTASVGISLYPRDGETAEVLVKNADAAMHKVKEDGHNNYRFYTETMNAETAERLRVELGLRRALERNEFVMHYQPRVDICTGAILGAEALLRWNNPEFGMVPPGDFIGLAEDTGLIVPITDWVLREVCEQSIRLREQGYSPMRLAVNISALHFQNKQMLLDSVETALLQSNARANDLEIEITEGALMQNTENAVDILNRLKTKGLSVALDDFGTGYSSLSYLKCFPIDLIKIDRSFVKDITGNPDDCTICGAIIGLAHNLKMRVVAEGVETQEQFDLLREMGCDDIQGYLVSRPVNASEFENMLSNAIIGLKAA